jgi:hypothetical protein
VVYPPRLSCIWLSHQRAHDLPSISTGATEGGSGSTRRLAPATLASPRRLPTFSLLDRLFAALDGMSF